MLPLLLLLGALFGSTIGQSFNPRPLSERGDNTPSVITPRFSAGVIEDAFIQARARVQTYRQRETQLVGRGRVVPRGISPVSIHNTLQAPNTRTRNLESQQLLFEETARILRDESGLTVDQIKYGLPTTQIQGRQAGQALEQCNAQFNNTVCDFSSRYRNLDGSCNNVENPNWGRASACFPRLLASDYNDGISSMRLSQSGQPLPNPRDISLTLHANINRPTEVVSHMIMQFGQFLDHDISLTPFSRTDDNQQIECCPPEDDDHPQCAAIILRNNDPFYSRFNQRCLNFVRSSPCPLCSLGPRQQLNQQTAFIDASQVYGTSAQILAPLRANTGGLLAVTDNNSGDLLPRTPDPNNDECSIPARQEFCFAAGDQRVNQHPALTSLHVVFLRHHNRLARDLQRLNSGWNDERLFQEARRILSAQMQMIVYNEFLPPVIGEERMNFFRLWVEREDVTEYDPTTEPTLANEFSTAAFRFGHSMINGFFAEITNGNNNDQGHDLRDVFFRPFELYNGRAQPFVQGLAEGRAQKFDRYMSPDVTNFLYRVQGNATGLDLASFNIQRGRDHGLPSYPNYVTFCGGPRINSFRDLDSLMSSENRRILENLYESVLDIDLFSGGLAETPRRGTIIGPTFTCIIGIQFYHLKYGDRFYFEHYGQTGSFTPAQLREIRKTTLAKIICETLRMNEIQRETMKYPSARNPKVLCNQLPDLDLSAWRV